MDQIDSQKLNVYNKFEDYFWERGISEPTGSIVNLIKNYLNSQTQNANQNIEEKADSENVAKTEHSLEDVYESLDLLNFLVHAGESVMALRNK